MHPKKTSGTPRHCVLINTWRFVCNYQQHTVRAIFGAPCSQHTHDTSWTLDACADSGVRLEAQLLRIGAAQRPCIASGTTFWDPHPQGSKHPRKIPTPPHPAPHRQSAASPAISSKGGTIRQTKHQTKHQPTSAQYVRQINGKEQCCLIKVLGCHADLRDGPGGGQFE